MKIKNLNPQQLWASSQKRGDIPELMRKVCITLKEIDMGYSGTIDGIHICYGDSPSDTRHKILKFLEKNITEKGTTQIANGNITIEEFSSLMVKVPKILFQQLEKLEQTTLGRRAHNAVLRRRRTTW